MKKICAKSPCCGKAAIHYGGRRRQCAGCGSTWRIRLKKRGRKRIAVSEDLVVRFFQKRLPPLRRIPGKKKDAMRLRLERSRERYFAANKDNWMQGAVSRGNLIAIADAIWYRIKREKHTIYTILLRPINSTEAVATPPVVIPGHECLEGWQEAFSLIPISYENRVLALVSDGATSLIALARRKSWIIQRCQFHLLAGVHNYLTTGPRSARRAYALEVVEIVKKLICSQNPEEVRTLLSQIQTIRNCSRSRGLRRVLGGLLRDVDEYRAFLKYPELNLPATSNAAESFIQCIRDLMYRCRGFRSLSALEHWLTGFSIFKKTVRCRGKNQPN